MIRLEHANLVVNHIQPTLDFLLTAFPDWQIRGLGEMKWGDKPRNWLHVGNDDYYLTLNDGGEGGNRDLSGHNVGLAHLGFVVNDIDEITTRLQKKGYQVDVEGPGHPYRKNVYFVDPAGFQFEFIQYFSDQSNEKNLYGGETSSVKRVSSI